MNLAYGGPAPEIRLNRSEEDIEFLYYEVVEEPHYPPGVNYLADFPSVEQIGTGDISFAYILRAGTLPRLRASMTLMAHVVSAYHRDRHQTAQRMYEAHRDEYSRGEYELLDKIEADDPPDDYRDRLVQPSRRADYVERYFEFCEGEPYADSQPKSRRREYRERVQKNPKA